MRITARFTPHFAAACAVTLGALVAPAASFAQGPAPAASSQDAEARRQTLNAEQAAAARAQVEANSASAARHDTAVALNDMQSQRDGDRYADALVRHDTAQQDYRQNRAEWERRNPYCWNGDAARCPADPLAPGS